MNCPVCLKDDWVFVRKNRSNGRDYVRCGRCGDGVIRMEPPIRAEEIAYDRPLPEGMVNDETYNAWQMARLGEFGLLRRARYLELGCGIGGLALKLQEMGKTVHVIEQNPHARRYCREHGLPAYSAYTDLPSSMGYDVVLSFHYLEHLANFKIDLAQQRALADCVFLCMPTGPAELDNPDHNWILSSERLVSMVLRGGVPILRKKLESYPLTWKKETGEITLLLIPGRRRFLASGPPCGWASRTRALLSSCMRVWMR